MLADSGHIQEEDANYWNKKRAKTLDDEIEPLYTVEDAKAAIKNFRPNPYGQPMGASAASGFSTPATWAASICPSYKTPRTPCPMWTT